MPSTNSHDEEDRTDSIAQCFQLGHTSLFILHPADEEPKKRDIDSFLSQIEPGNVKFGVDRTLSCALIFHSVTSTVIVIVNTIGNKLVPSKGRNMVQQHRDAETDRLVHNYFVSGAANEDYSYYYSLFYIYCS